MAVYKKKSVGSMCNVLARHHRTHAAQAQAGSVCCTCDSTETLFSQTRYRAQANGARPTTHGGVLGYLYHEILSPNVAPPSDAPASTAYTILEDQ